MRAPVDAVIGVAPVISARHAEFVVINEVQAVPCSQSGVYVDVVYARVLVLVRRRVLSSVDVIAAHDIQHLRR